MTKQVIGMFVAVCTVMACAMPLAAQETPPLVRVVRFHVKPDRTAEFRDVQARLTESAKQDGRTRGVWRNVNNSSEYGVITYRDNYASFDAQLSRTMPDSEFRALLARISQCYDDRDVVIYSDFPNVTIVPPAPPKMVRTRTLTIRPGTVAKFRELREQLFDHMKKVGVPGFGLRQVRFGGSRNTYMTWRSVENMAEFDGPGWGTKAFESMGEEAASKWLEENSKVVLSSEIDLYVYEPDLSYYAEP